VTRVKLRKRPSTALLNLDNLIQAITFTNETGLELVAKATLHIVNGRYELDLKLGFADELAPPDIHDVG